MPENSGLFELSVTRHIAATPQKVWQIMTGRQAEWWCPEPWRTEIVEQSWRAGGRSAMILRGPDGEAETLEGIFLEVSPGKRFVTTDAITHNWEPNRPFMIGIWAVQAEGDGSRYTASARHWTTEAMRQHKEMGFAQGWSACAEQLAMLAESTRKTL